MSEILPEDRERFQLWLEGLTELGLVAEEINSRTWLLKGRNDSVIATITYNPEQPFADRFGFCAYRDPRKESTPDSRNYAQEFAEGNADCQACEGTGTVIRQGKTVECFNCGGTGWQSTMLPHCYEES